MSYYPTNVAGQDLVSDPTTGSFHSRDPFSAEVTLSPEPPQPQAQLSTTRAEKPHHSNALGYSPGAVSYAYREEWAAKAHGSVQVVARVPWPWYRTRRGVIVIAIVAFITLTIGATLGVILGVTRH